MLKKLKKAFKAKESKNCLGFIKNTFMDIFFLFKNFIHWNISKIIIFLWSIVLGFIFIIPILIIFFIYMFFSEVTIANLVSGFFAGGVINDFFGMILLYFMIALFFIGFSYSNLLMFRLNYSYIEGKKLKFEKNDYFNYTKIFRYINITLINIAILLLPIIGFAIVFGALFFIAGGSENILALVSGGYNNYFSIISFILIILFLIISFYLFIRLSFSYFILMDNKKYKKVHSSIFYVKEAFKLTKKISSIFKLVIISVLVILITSPLLYLGQVLDNNNKLLGDYSQYINANKETKSQISANSLYYYESLSVEFKDLSSDEVSDKLKYSYYYLVLYTIMNFLVINGLLLMVFSSFYKRELSK